MTDRHIDADEMEIYGPYAVDRLRRVVHGRVAELDGAVEHFASEVAHATAAVREAHDATRGGDVAARAARATLTPVLDEATGCLSRFSAYLDSLPSVDRHRFFPQDGTVHGVGRTPAKILLGLQRIGIQLGDVTVVPDALRWQTEVQGIASRLAPVLATAGVSRGARHADTPALVAARAAWLATYRAARCQAEAVLRLAGRLDLMPSVFYDLAIPDGRSPVDLPPPPADVVPTPHVAVPGAAASPPDGAGAPRPGG